MTDGWYYVDGDARRGPVTLAELAARLSAKPQPYDVVVWRPGLESWQRAENVAGVAAALAAGPDHASRRAPEPAGAAELIGIRGWLILLALWQLLATSMMFVSIARYYAAMDSSVMRQFPITLAGEVLLNVAMAMLYAATSILFLSKSTQFPQFFVYQVVAAVLLVPVATVWTGLAMGLESGRSAVTIMLDSIDPHQVRQATFAAIFGTIWILYLKKSRRVANTFAR
jgi:Protein of unknown function (DUF2569)/GYF domain 2